MVGHGLDQDFRQSHGRLLAGLGKGPGLVAVDELEHAEQRFAGIRGKGQGEDLAPP